MSIRLLFWKISFLCLFSLYLSEGNSLRRYGKELATIPIYARFLDYGLNRFLNGYKDFCKIFISAPLIFLRFFCYSNLLRAGIFRAIVPRYLSSYFRVSFLCRIYRIAEEFSISCPEQAFGSVVSGLGKCDIPLRCDVANQGSQFDRK